MSRQNNIINKPEPAPGTLGKLDLFGIGFGAVVGAGMVTLMGPAMAYTGYSVWLAMLLATVLALVLIFPYIILGGTLRVAGGQYSVVTNLTSPSAGGLVIYSNLIFTVQFSTFAMAFGLYMNMVLPTVSAKIFGITIIFLLVGLNLLGINAFAKINNLMSGILLVSMVAYDIYGLTELSGPGVAYECSAQTGMHINEDPVLRCLPAVSRAFSWQPFFLSTAAMGITDSSILEKKQKAQQRICLLPA